MNNENKTHDGIGKHHGITHASARPRWTYIMESPVKERGGRREREREREGGRDREKGSQYLRVKRVRYAFMRANAMIAKKTDSFFPPVPPSSGSSADLNGKSGVP